MLLGMKLDKDNLDIWLTPIPYSSSNCTELQFKVDAAHIGGITIHQTTNTVTDSKLVTGKTSSAGTVGTTGTGWSAIRTFGDDQVQLIDRF